MNLFRAGTMSALVVSAIILTAPGASAEHKLCVNDSTGATRVIEAPERCRKAETGVVIPHEADGETVKASSYVMPGSVASGGSNLKLYTKNGQIRLSINCNYGGTLSINNAAYWAAENASVTAGSTSIFNNVEGQTFQAFNDLYYGGGSMDDATLPSRPWTGVFIARQGNAMSRFEVTVSDKNPRGDCLVTLFSVGLGSATVQVVSP